MKKIFSKWLNIKKSRLPVVQSEHLFVMSKEIRIEHNGEEYRLKLTSNDSLVLTK